MNRRWRQFAAGLLTLAGALGVLVLGGDLAIGAARAALRFESEKKLVAELTEKAQTDRTFSLKAHAELDRQTETSLKRDMRRAALAPYLAFAAVAFVIGCKWLVSTRKSGVGENKALLCTNHEATTSANVYSTVQQGGNLALPKTQNESLALPVLEQIDVSAVDAIVARCGTDSHAAIPILQAIQEHYRYLPQAALRRVCELTEISAGQLVGVASFYTHFRKTPVGEHLLKVCHGTACHVAGAERITDELRRHLGIAPGHDTDAARKYTIESVACMGCCTLAPVAQLDDVTHGHLQPATAVAMIEEARHPKSNGHRGRRRRDLTDGDLTAVPGEIRIGLGSCCVANGSANVQQALQTALAGTGVRTTIKRVGCVGMCHQTPLVEIDLPGRPAARYSRVQPEHVEQIVSRHFRPPSLPRRIGRGLREAYDFFVNGSNHDAARERAIAPSDPPVAAFLGSQIHIATEHCGVLDPCDLDEYLKYDGFKALERAARELAADDVIDQIRRSGLRGRGGAGFPTGEKWSRVRKAVGKQKYIICNGDEGDPGAFMDRMLMESYPYRIIEGVAIAALAVGAEEGFFYIRHEYPLAVRRIREAIEKCEQRGILGDNVLGAGRRLKLRIMEGAGAFVCGEETALIASIEGRRGTPTLRPPFPADAGLWGKPTLVSNVETYACVPWILRHGADAFAAMGTATSKGTKVFALAGKVARGGLIEVPMGITIRQIVEVIGGGAKPESTRAGVIRHRFKAVQIGGPSGGCIPAALADTPVDFEALAKLGAIMGSGGLVVMDETDCMVDIARYFLSFTQDQSCGQCTPCRIGTRRMLEILERLCAGQGKRDDIEKLEELAHSVKASSLCGLGKTAPNPVLTTLQYFRDEYEAHLQGRCPAGKCKALIRYEVTDACTGCTLCAQHCPTDAIPTTPYEKHEIIDDKCTRCDTCRVECPEGAIRISEKINNS